MSHDPASGARLAEEPRAIAHATAACLHATFRRSFTVEVAGHKVTKLARHEIDNGDWKNGVFTGKDDFAPPSAGDAGKEPPPASS